MRRLMAVQDVLELPALDKSWRRAGDNLKWVTDSLVEDIRANGLKNPIQVAPLSQLVIDWPTAHSTRDLDLDILGLGNGHHRLAAVTKLGWLWVETTDSKSESKGY